MLWVDSIMDDGLWFIDYESKSMTNSSCLTHIILIEIGSPNRMTSLWTHSLYLAIESKVLRFSLELNRINFRYQDAD